jgi:hypothetical protein
MQWKNHKINALWTRSTNASPTTHSIMPKSRATQLHVKHASPQPTPQHTIPTTPNVHQQIKVIS